MIARYTYNGLTWVDLEKPTREEVALLEEEFALPRLVGEELLSSTLRSKVDLYDNLIYLILHFPVIDKTMTGRSGEQEIDFIIGKSFLITIRYDAVDPIHQFARLFETNTLPSHKAMPTHAGIVFMNMMKQFYKRSLHELEDITKTIKHIEDHIFESHEGSVVKEISYTTRKLLDFKQATRFHRNILQSYETASIRFFGDDYSYYASLITSEFNKVDSLLESHRDIIGELQNTNNSLLSTKTNEVMKALTIITFIMMPLVIIPGIFAMNSQVIFIKTIPDFFFVIFAMSIAALVMFVYFKFRKWL